MEALIRSLLESPLLAADAPQVDAKFVVALLSRIFHILSAVILGGGVFYLRSILSHSGVDALYASRRAVWARWVAIASSLLALSGMYNYILVMQASKLAGARPIPIAYHILFLVKFLLGIFVMFVAAILAGKTTTADRFRASMSKWLNLAWGAVMTIIVLAAIMRTMH